MNQSKRKTTVITAIALMILIVIGVVIYVLVGSDKGYVAKVGDVKITQDELTDAMQIPQTAVT
ncbi:hypothetical protein [Kurthia massiliensis]|uniref:hypothetical protein n=1 Tax=Kurthia massiliensis TaxID=1033739 RepID=UPI0011CAF605|nr:hypothetical protein [Kurthia massiliensis]